jgi:tetratricopeptide (TPR) repeat protein
LWQQLATIAIDSGQHATVVAVLQQGLTLARRVGDRALIAHAAYNLGALYHHLGEPEQAQAGYQESLDLRREIGDSIGSIEAFNGLGLVYWANGAVQEALDCFTESSRLCERYGLPDHQATALLDIGQLLLEQEQIGGAQAHLRQACDLYTRVGDRIGEAHCRYLLGDIALLRGDPAAAHGEGTESLSLARTAGSAAIEACALRVLGEALYAQGRLAAADERLAQAWQVQLRAPNSYDEALILAPWAAVALGLSQPTVARERAAAALARARDQHMARLIERMESLLQNM